MHGMPWFRGTVTECAWSASRTKNSAFQSCYHRLNPRIGHKGELVAVAHALLKSDYYVRATKEPYKEDRSSRRSCRWRD
jgi:hypothetical protein